MESLIFRVVFALGLVGSVVGAGIYLWPQAPVAAPVVVAPTAAELAAAQKQATQAEVQSLVMKSVVTSVRSD